MIYIDSVKFLELIAESRRSESKFCRDAGISRQAFTVSPITVDQSWYRP